MEKGRRRKKEELPLSERLLLGVPEIAHVLGISTQQVRVMIRAGKFPVVRVGTLIKVKRQTILDWIDRNERFDTKGDLDSIDEDGMTALDPDDGGSESDDD